MARQTIYQYTSDISGTEIKDSDTPVLIRISWPNDPERGTVVLDASEIEVKDLLDKGRTEKSRGRPRGKSA
jgi:hypothetical protein